MIFVETPLFTAQIKALVSDEEYAAFQRELAADPEAGDVIAGLAACEKSAWPRKEKANAAAPA